MQTKILVIEDEIIVAKDVKRILEEHKYHVCGIEDSGEAVIKAIKQEKYKPDLMIVDIKLNGKMDGIQLAEQCWENYNIPSVFLTIYGEQEVFQKAKKTAFSYIVKPVLPDELVRSIDLALNLSGKINDSKILLSNMFHRVKNDALVMNILWDDLFKKLSKELTGKLNKGENIEKNQELLSSFYGEIQLSLRTISRIYEVLYKTKESSTKTGYRFYMDKVDFEEYIGLMVKEYQKFLGNLYQIKIDFEIDKVFFDYTTTQSLGLIVTEALLNTIKHAFPDKKGKFGITLHKKAGQYILLISDNGKGFDQKLFYDSDISYGLGLMRKCIEKLNGKCEIGTQKGTEYKIVFKA